MRHCSYIISFSSQIKCDVSLPCLQRSPSLDTVPGHPLHTVFHSAPLPVPSGPTAALPSHPLEQTSLFLYGKGAPVLQEDFGPHSRAQRSRREKRGLPTPWGIPRTPKVHQTWPRPRISVLSLSPFTFGWQSRVAAIQIPWLMKAEIFTIWRFTEKKPC